MVKTDIHADDYALTPNTSRDMLTCMKEGWLDSISVVPNMSCFEECMNMLYKEIPDLPFLPVMSVHLDFVEGRGYPGAVFLSYPICLGSARRPKSSLRRKSGRRYRLRGRRSNLQCILHKNMGLPADRRGCALIPTNTPT